MKRIFTVFLYLMLISVLAVGCASGGESLTPDPNIISTLPFISAQTYYVDHEQGSDTYDGSREQPWQTIQKAANTTGPGDTVIVREGEYTERVNVNISGSPDHPIDFRAEGNVKMEGFTILANNITVKGFYITNSLNNDMDGAGIFISGNGCLIENNHIYFTPRRGVLLNNPSNGCIVRNNQIERVGWAGIEVQGKNHLIENNEIWETIQYHPLFTAPDADGMRFFGSGHIFRGNYIHDIHYGIPENVNPHIDCFQTWDDTSRGEIANHIIFEKNICINFDAQSKLEAGQGIILEGGAHDILIRNNIFRSFKGVNSFGSSRITIVNNVFAGDPGFNTSFEPIAIWLDGDIKDVVQNNIFYDHIWRGLIPTTEARATLVDGYNLSFRSDGEPLLYDAPYPPNATDLWGLDPMFVNPSDLDFRLRAGSPAIDAGNNLGNLVPDSFNGTVRPQGAGFDIGAFEMTTN